MLSSEPTCCWANAKIIGLVFGFTRIILISNMIAFHGFISMPFSLYFQEAIVPRKFITNNYYQRRVICNKFISFHTVLFVCFDICWIHGIYKVRSLQRKMK